MGVLHFFCCGDDYPHPHDPNRGHSPHPTQFHDGRAHHHHYHDQHFHNQRVPTPRQDCLNVRGNGSPGCGWNSGLRNPAVTPISATGDHHGNGHRGLSPHPNPFKRNSGEVWSNANGAGGVGLTNREPNTPQENNVGQMGNCNGQWPNGPQGNNVTWDGANGGNPMTGQWHSGPSNTNYGSWNGANGTNVDQMGTGTTNHQHVEQKAQPSVEQARADTKAGNDGKGKGVRDNGSHGQSGGVQAAPDGGVVSYNITIHKHMCHKGGEYTKVNKNDIHFQL